MLKHYSVGPGSQGKVTVGTTNPFRPATQAEWPASEEGLTQAHHVADAMNKARSEGMEAVRSGIRSMIGAAGL